MGRYVIGLYSSEHFGYSNLFEAWRKVPNDHPIGNHVYSNRSINFREEKITVMTIIVRHAGLI